MGRTDIWAPVLYVSLLIGALSIFSYFYRKRAAKQQKFLPWFPTHPERDLYVSLLQKNAPDSLLKAALLRRAVEDVTRILRIREDKAALQALIQKGSVGDDLWSSCLAAEKEMEVELLEVMSEANTFRQGWGQIIFGSASEIMHHDKIKEALNRMPTIRSEAEAKYGGGKQRSMLPPSTPSTLPAASPAKPVSRSASTSAKPSLTVPESPSNGTARLSDDESATSMSGAPSVQSSRKSSGKKGKKRK